MTKRKTKLTLILSLIINSITYSFGQNIKVNDSVYVNVIEDTLYKDVSLNRNTSYQMGVYFSGFIYKEIYEVKKGLCRIYYDTISTWDRKDISTYAATRRFFLKVKRRKKNNDFWLLHNKDKINLPFKYGYQILTISIDGRMDENNRKVTKYKFLYSNRLPAII